MSKKSLLREYAEALLIALILAMFIRTFVVQAFKIPSESMLQTLQVGDRLLVNKFIYGVKMPFSNKYLIDGENPQRGDIVVFEYPLDTSVDFIKRVIGVPGDVIEVRNKQLYRNGKPVKEPYVITLEPDVIIPGRDQYGPVTVPSGKYFCMGDNRDNSKDSRSWGFVEKSAILGKAWRIYWSFGDHGDVRWNRIGKLLQ